MTINSQEALASLRVLVCVAMADGKLHENERIALDAALEDIKEVNAITLDDLLAETIDLESQLSLIFTQSARELTYNTAYTMANIDGECNPTEQAILDRLKSTFQLSQRKVDLLSTLVNEVRETFLLKGVQPISDPSKREIEVKKLILSYAKLSAIFRAFPALGAAISAQILICTYQCQMIREIGTCWQQDPEQIDARALLGSMLSGESMEGMRISISSLVKLAPVWSSARDIPAFFAATWAVGLTTNQYFASEGNLDAQALHTAFQQAKPESEAAFKDNKEAIRDRIRELDLGATKI